MAKNKVTIDIEVNGKMQKATVSAKKLRDALKSAGDAGNQAAQGAANADRNLKGLSSQSANATKNFSKMAQGMSGFLVPAYATLAANVFALSAAFNFLKSAGNLAALQAGQEQYARRTGTSMTLLTRQLQDATGGLVAYQEAAQAAAIGNAAGLTADQLTRLASIAKNAGTVLGRDVTDSFNRLTRGAIKAEPELLDELGIIVRLKDASEAYADALDINANSLTTFQKTQAVVNATIEEGERKFQDVGNQVNAVAQLGVALEDTFKTVKEGVAAVSNFIAGALNQNIYALIAALGLLGTSFIRAIAPAGPGLMNISQGADDARKRIAAGLNKKTATGKAVRSGDFGPKTMYNLERASKAAQSSIRNESKLTQMQMKRDLLIIRAEMIRTSAQGKGAFSVMFANWKAQLLLFQADHGRVMGTIKAVTAAAATVMSRLLTFAAWIGMAIMLVALVKQAMEYFKDPELRAVEEMAKNNKESFEQTIKAVEDLKAELEDARSPMEAIVQNANLLANFKFTEMRKTLRMMNEIDKNSGINDIDMNIFKNLEDNARKAENALKSVAEGTEERWDETGNFIVDLLNGIGKRATMDSASGGLIQTTMEEPINEAKKAIENFGSEVFNFQDYAQKQNVAVGSVVDSFAQLDAQFTILKQSGRDTSGLEDQIEGLGMLASALRSGQLEGTAYIEGLKTFKGVYKEVISGTSALTGEVLAQKNAFMSLSQTLEAFTQSGKALELRDSPFTQIFGQLDSASQAVKTLTQNGGLSGNLFQQFAGSGEKGDYLYDQGVVQYNALLKLAGLQDRIGDKTVTFAEVQKALDERRNRMLENALLLEEQRFNLQTAQERALRGATKLQAQQVKFDMAEINAQQALNELIAKKSAMEESNGKLSDEQLRVHEAQKTLLEEQLETARLMTQEFYRLGEVTKQSFESGLASGFDNFITNKEGSLGDGLKTLAKGIFEAMSKEVSNMLSKKVMDGIFGKKDPAVTMQQKIEKGGNNVASSIKKAMVQAADYLAQKLGISAAGAPSMAVGEPDAILNSKYLTNQDAKKNPLGNLSMGPSLDEQQNPGKKPLGYFERIFGAKEMGGKDEVTMGSEGGLETVGLNKTGGSFGNFLGSLGDIFDKNAEGGLVQKLGNAFDAGGNLFSDIFGGLGNVFKDLLGGLFGGGAGGGGLGALFTGMFGFANGGIAKGGITGYSKGGIVKRPTMGLVGEGKHNEAIVPLPDGKAIPVDFGKSMGQQNNVTVNVSVDGEGRASQSKQSDSGNAANLGAAIASAVQKELLNQKRPGGMLHATGMA